MTVLLIQGAYFPNITEISWVVAYVFMNFVLALELFRKEEQAFNNIVDTLLFSNRHDNVASFFFRLSKKPSSPTSITSTNSFVSELANFFLKPDDFQTIFENNLKHTHH